MKCDIAPNAAEERSSAVEAKRLATPPPVELVSPSRLRRDIPLSEAARAQVERTRSQIANILSGRDRDRLLVVSGPCSIDDVDAAVVYAEKLGKLAEEVSDRVLLVMRCYFEKPRSVLGWKGLIYDPLMGAERGPAMDGLSMARRLLTHLADSGVGCATEFLNPMLAPYLEDAISYGSIGSRTVESQLHREMASSMTMPIGMKNGMDGDPKSALNAVLSAAQPHSYFGVSDRGMPCWLQSSGNPATHVILRGGSSGPNFHQSCVNQTVEAARRPDLQRPVVVDCSHGNSAKDHRRQEGVAQAVAQQFAAGQGGIAGLMLESNLVEGQQGLRDGVARVFGKSITDSCIGWNDTERIVRLLASNLGEGGRRR
ncbi:3-deoxy-7-phosphoheptulonate synthase [Pelagicoccus sp. SDUM812003]|uniref:3-deoxy-7-phosphoheptulonate synthase n=1 Tax=Pelagicoccus sp. SDUM812003 TaxID=3041267 RepID=UPI00280EBCE4|nr:3-deoxy-7-phosphoheptulonate synthase [Pelagicoccus sp. SDUM812003]MDQ8201845.1 3-deoxy-7-phosphoheptulonate synthase [Pelagicoccus sp. SDUM812003]